MKISIEYCVKWNYRPRASSLEDELREQLGSTVDVRLIGGENGVFEITVEGDLIFAKSQLGRFPNDGEIINLIRQGQ